MNSFSEEDKKKFIEFLNMVATHGQFTVSTGQMINYVKLLSHMQQVLLPKLDAHILEVLRVVTPPKEGE
jgi:hypothetical protein